MFTESRWLWRNTHQSSGDSVDQSVNPLIHTWCCCKSPSLWTYSNSPNVISWPLSLWSWTHSHPRLIIKWWREARAYTNPPFLTPLRNWLFHSGEKRAFQNTVVSPSSLLPPEHTFHLARNQCSRRQLSHPTSLPPLYMPMGLVSME